MKAEACGIETFILLPRIRDITNAFRRKDEEQLDSGMNVVLYEKRSDGELRVIEERVWNANMIAALEHVNYLVVQGQEYETVEGRLNLDDSKLELLLVPLRND